ncbi:MAG: PDZ domain-containing protein [Thermoanaerobaculia bacterium]
MRTLVPILVSLLLLAVPARGGEACSAPARECEIQIREMLEGQSYLGVLLERTSLGVMIRSVIPGSPAERGGFRNDDLLIAINGRDVSRNDIRQVKRLFQEAAEKNDGQLNVVVTRYGDVRRVRAEMGKMPEEHIRKAIQAHLKEAHGSTGTGQ